MRRSGVIFINVEIPRSRTIFRSWWTLSADSSCWRSSVILERYRWNYRVSVRMPRFDSRFEANASTSTLADELGQRDGFRFDFEFRPERDRYENCYSANRSTFGVLLSEPDLTAVTEFSSICTRVRISWLDTVKRLLCRNSIEKTVSPISLMFSC